MAKQMGERKEAWFRIIVAIISGIILSIWKILIYVLGIIHWIIVVFSRKRNKGISLRAESSALARGPGSLLRCEIHSSSRDTQKPLLLRNLKYN